MVTGQLVLVNVIYSLFWHSGYDTTISQGKVQSIF